MATTNLNIRTDKAIKDRAEKIFNELGLNMTIAAISNVVGIVFHYFNWNSGLAPKRLENRKGV